MTNNQYINAYKKTQQSSNVVTSSHEIVRTLMKELVNSMQKIVLDIQEERKRKQQRLLPLHAESLQHPEAVMRKN